MNLFTTIQGSSADTVQTALRNAAASTGTEFDYLLSTAKRESGLRPDARNPTSSASGLFQFIDSTWLDMMKQAGPGLGLGDYAAAIETGASGARVADPAMRQAIMGLRSDPAINAMLAGALTQNNRAILTGSLGREPSDGELYMAHFMGAQGASSLIRMAAQNGETSAVAAFPRQAAANPAIFFDRDGRARSASEVYQVLADGPAASVATEDDETLPQNPAAWLAIPAHNAYTAEASTPFHSLFRSTTGAPVSNHVAATWSGLKPLALEASRVPAPPAEPMPVMPSGAVPIGSGEPVATAAPATAEPEGVLGSIGSFFTTLFAASQSAPLRVGNAWGC
jgi:hypothetical protein